ncbi:RNA polymerase-associated protein RapA [Kushneria phosphatilytica]|uniref:RNA polymerase-associated protein RapA n=1 Tax=Kushneria phosphatilytica TaxID=657387 RepID=UPI000A4C152F|nr:RNA polymerase-associated protein RapA [Kushneria phosphatilytica]
MSDFIPGQRFISDGEADLGLGTVLNCDQRSVTVLFAGGEQTRTYSVREAPLTRVVFGSGDRIETDEGETLIVSHVEEQHGMLIYHGDTREGASRQLPESRISDRMQFHQARDRLLTGQLERNDAFNLRYRSLQHLQRIERHPAFGLSGPRIDLIGHQLHIADEVSHRRLPRVLLADEVGLGKTIEAGLILHRLLLTGRVRRALVLVPESLTHQWLVELLRRFSLEVTLLDEAQSRELDTDSNPFESGQIVLASQQWLFADEHRQRQAREAGWDLLIVDEAQHLHWSPEGSDHGYACVAALAAGISGVMLLTATPEQSGAMSHFAQLRLLDPERYHDFDAFQAEQSGHVAIANAVEAIEPLPDESARATVETASDDSEIRELLEQFDTATVSERPGLQQQLRRILLDRYGVGRVMFRNSRRHVGGFPERRLHVETLELPQGYRRTLRRLERDEDYLDELLLDTGLNHPDVLLYPELTFEALRQEESGEAWWRFDPRLDWLRGWLKATPR